MWNLKGNGFEVSERNRSVGGGEWGVRRFPGCFWEITGGQGANPETKSVVKRLLKFFSRSAGKLFYDHSQSTY